MLWADATTSCFPLLLVFNLRLYNESVTWWLEIGKAHEFRAFQFDDCWSSQKLPKTSHFYNGGAKASPRIGEKMFLPSADIIHSNLKAHLHVPPPECNLIISRRIFFFFGRTTNWELLPSRLVKTYLNRVTNALRHTLFFVAGFAETLRLY